MRRIYVPLIATFACAGLFFLPQMHNAFAHGPERTMHQDFPPRPGATPIVIGLPNLNPPTATALPAGSHPHVPPKARAPQDVVRVALANAYVKALLSGKPYRIRRVSPWGSSTGKLIVIGFYATTTVSGTWMPPGKPPHQATYYKVTGIRVYIGASRRVAGIVPGFGAK